MSERSMGGPMRTPDLDAELRVLAGSIDWPPTPDVTAAIAQRLADAGRPSVRRLGALPQFSRALVLAIVLLLVAVAVAAAIVFGLPGLRISFTSDPLPSPNLPLPSATVTPSSSSAPGLGLALGTPVSLEVAAERLGRPLLIPSSVARPPDAAYVESVRGTPIVTLVWRAGQDLPPLTTSSDVGLLVSQFPAALDEALLEKILRQGETTVERLEVGGNPAFWISGIEHILWFRRADGDVVETFVRLVGDTLAVEVDGTVVRIETSGGRDGAIKIAGSLR